MKPDRRDSHFMALALRLAAKGAGRTSPNPMVGAVVVARGRIVGSGYHARAGAPHAEVIALERAGRQARGATLYVTLEPCCHTDKRTPPCVPAVLAAGLRRIVVAMSDPNPRVRGRGIRQLRKARVKVEVGVLEQEAEQLNEAYCHWIRTGRPFVTMKAGVTLDGKIATASGESRWITGERARREAHRIRSRTDAVLVGIGTVLRDDPQLTARHAASGHAEVRGPQPLRVILDSTLRMPLNARVLARGTSSPSPSARGAGARRPDTLIATTAAAPKRRLHRLYSLGVPAVVLPREGDRVSLTACLTYLGRMDVTTVLIEGGSDVNAAALRAGLVNRVIFFIAPMLLGGQDAKSVIGGKPASRLADAWHLTNVRARRVGEDLMVEGSIQSHRARRPRSNRTRKRKRP